jgi:hypothetical protein
VGIETYLSGSNPLKLPSVPLPGLPSPGIRTVAQAGREASKTIATNQRRGLNRAVAPLIQTITKNHRLACRLEPIVR